MKINEATFFAQHKHGRKCYKGEDLQWLDMAGYNLEDYDFTGADLRKAFLRESNLQRADLRGADLRGADLRGADFTGANLQNAQLQAADIRGANFDNANLQGTILRDVDLRITDEDVIEVETYAPRITVHGVECGVDVDFKFSGYGIKALGQVTMVKHRLGYWTPFGNCPEHWVSGNALDKLKGLDECKFGNALLAISSAALKAIEDSSEDCESYFEHL